MIRDLPPSFRLFFSLLTCQKGAWVSVVSRTDPPLPLRLWRIRVDRIYLHAEKRTSPPPTFHLFPLEVSDSWTLWKSFVSPQQRGKIKRQINHTDRETRVSAEGSVSCCESSAPKVFERVFFCFVLLHTLWFCFLPWSTSLSYFVWKLLSVIERLHFHIICVQLI